MARLFFDASVIFAAAFSEKGSAAFLVSECEAGRFQAVTNSLVLMEVSRNLTRKADQEACDGFCAW
jgi:predicted nucleic acid-binding protein